jgi:hypothetical protein
VLCRTQWHRQVNDIDCLECVFQGNGLYSSTDTLTLAKEDFHLCDTSQPIKIEVTFEDLSPSAQEDFKDYFRNDKLIVSAVGKWSEISQSAPVKQYGERLGIQEFRGYFDQDKAGAKAPELQAAYDAVREKYPDLPVAKTKPVKEEALHAYESNHPEKCELIQSEDPFLLGPKFSKRERSQMNLSRFYLMAQIEYCRNFIFKRHFPIHKIFERGCEIGLWRLTANRISEIFGVRRTKKLRGKIATVIEQIEHGHHVFRAYWKNALTPLRSAQTQRPRS